MSGTDLAPAHQTWVCAGCGKTSRSRYGIDASGKSVADAGWDEICMMHAVLCELTGAEVGMKWRAAKEVTETKANAETLTRKGESNG